MIPLDDILVNVKHIINSNCTNTECLVTYSRNPTDNPFFHLTSTCTKSLEPESFELLSTQAYRQLQHDILTQEDTYKREREDKINRELSKIPGLKYNSTHIRKGFTKIAKTDIDHVNCSNGKCIIKYHQGKRDYYKEYRMKRRSK